MMAPRSPDAVWDGDSVFETRPGPDPSGSPDGNMRDRRMSPSIGSDTDTRRSPAQYLQPADQGADALGMESWDEWETEIQERLAELNNEHSSPEPERERRWESIGSAGVLTTEGVARFRAFLSRVKREWILHGPRV
jgi:hypothetical protein